MVHDYWSDKEYDIYFDYNEEFVKALNDEVNKVNAKEIEDDFHYSYSLSHINNIKEDIEHFNDPECTRMFDEFNRCYRMNRTKLLESLIKPIEFKAETFFTIQDNCAKYKLEFRSITTDYKFKSFTHTIYRRIDSDKKDDSDSDSEFEDIDLLLSIDEEQFVVPLQSLMKYVIKIDETRTCTKRH